MAIVRFRSFAPDAMVMPLMRAPAKVLRRSFSTVKTTHFGFQQVNEQDKKPMVAGVFHSVADSYDMMNDAMSGGMHRLWKDEFINMLGPLPHKTGEPLRILDVAGGTGDIAFRMAERLTKGGLPRTMSEEEAASGRTDIVVCDINDSMLRVGEERATARGIGLPGARPSFAWVQGDAEQLQFESDSFDVYTIAFGIRNVTHVDKALAEAHRVLRKGGRFMCLEFSQVRNPLLRAVYDQYSFNLIPAMGELLAKDRASYQYLVESIRQFPVQEDFKGMIENAGFSKVSYTNFMDGVVAVHSGFKL
ncbi:ubiquinone/menaquinone biosynthesis methyltransferase ubiE [Achlya hypogyna]|uniref:2-methoxy-6-polyprenyl-1,4-benzoquinol methylase, mitochondrial n=1 Tax=Achlya hypogyna TaxID=1202772 RepID=A0A1V9Z1D7_ACHHY|nr:ubiquinone/menaquinone biosynthesis methyltransferase ubiE [Achlya hypogyna]